MTEIYSVVEPGKLLHKIVRASDFVDGRIDIIDESQFIQCSILSNKAGKTFRPHKHIWKPVNHDTIAQESWVIIRGSVRGIFYDLDNTLLETHTLFPGDASFTLEGGHNYEILEDDTLVYEYKTGPYLGQAMDKVFIDEVDV